MSAPEHLLLRAVSVAQSARDNGNHPFGALLTDSSGRELLSAENTVVTASDATGHAETNLVRLATARYSTAELREMTLYTSTEPCAMCSGAIYWSGIGTVVYALGEDELRAMTGDDPVNPTLELPCRSVFAAGQRSVAVFGPFDIVEARAVHEAFWHPMA